MTNIERWMENSGVKEGDKVLLLDQPGGVLGAERSFNVSRQNISDNYSLCNVPQTWPCVDAVILTTERFDGLRPDRIVPFYCLSPVSDDDLQDDD